MFHYALNELWCDLGQDIKEEDVMVKWNYFGHRSQLYITVREVGAVVFADVEVAGAWE